MEGIQDKDFNFLGNDKFLNPVLQDMGENLRVDIIYRDVFTSDHL